MSLAIPGRSIAHHAHDSQGQSKGCKTPRNNLHIAAFCFICPVQSVLSQSVWQVLQNVRCCNKTVSWRLLHPARNEYKVNMWAAACIWWGLLIGEQVWYLSWRDALAISIRNWIYCDAAAATVTTIQITTWLTYWMKAQSATRMKYYVRWIDMSSTVTSLHIRFITESIPFQEMLHSQQQIS